MVPRIYFPLDLMCTV